MWPKQKDVRAAAADVIPHTPIELVTIPDVEIGEVGENWRLSTGLTTFTQEDFQAAVAAMDDPFIRTPKLKIGHSDPRFDGEPTFGKIDNLRMSSDGMTLVGDFVGVPAWMAEIMPSAWPQRSLEGAWNVKTAAGKTHSFVITAVALLGETDPGIETLADLQTLWEKGPATIEASPAETTATKEGEIDVGAIREKIHRAAEVVRAAVGVAASVAVEDVRRAYYDTLESSQMWWWIREIQIDPAQLIVDDDEGSLYRVTYAISGDDITFGEPTKVEIQYQDVAAGRIARKVFASKDESRAGVGPEKEEAMDPKLKAALIKVHGLADDATDEQVTEAVAQAAETPPAVETEEKEVVATTTTEKETTEPVVPEAGTVVVDEATVEELKTAASRGQAAWTELQTAKHNGLLDDAVKAGKFAPSRREHFAGLLKADEEGTTKLIESLAAGIVPVELRGHNTETSEGGAQADAYPSHWLPEVAARKAREERQSAGRV